LQNEREKVNQQRKVQSGITHLIHSTFSAVLTKKKHMAIGDN